MIINLDQRIWGVDVSSWQDDADTSAKPDLTKLKAAGASFLIARTTNGYVSAGKPVIDRMFEYYRNECERLGLQFGAYAYMNYYSYPTIGVTPEQWGKIQGEAVVEALKGNQYPVFMDVESAPGAQKVETVWQTAMAILDSELETIDTLNERKTGLYIATGWLSKYPATYHDRPLWVANYNPVTEDYVRSIVAKSGFTKLRIIQANSLGDIDGDKIPDGKRLGFENNNVDIDLWTASAKDYITFWRLKLLDPPAPDIPTPEPEPSDEEKLRLLWDWYLANNPR